MSVLSEEVIKRIQQIDRETAYLNKQYKGTEGRIRVSKDNGYHRYYLVLPESSPGGVYLKKSERKLASELIQKEYEDRIRKSLNAERAALLRLQRFYQANSDDDHFYYGPEERIWSHLGEGRRSLAVPALQDDERFIKKWLSEEYERKPFAENAPEYYTGSGIRVRSKTELIIAEILEKKDIPFYYEKPININGYGRIYPDFTVLNVKTRTTMYWEHMGMMDDPQYQDHALERITHYEMAGFYPGKTLILTFESSSRPVKTRLIEKMIDIYLL